VLFGLLPGAAAPEDEGPSMSIVRVAQVRAFLRITHRQDDAMLQDLINGAEAAALAYMDRERLPRPGEFQVDECDSNTPPLISDSDDLAYDVRLGVYLHVQAHYECEADDRAAGVEAAEQKWFPYRNQLGA
jgi:hypothetical protein